MKKTLTVLLVLSGLVYLPSVFSQSFQSYDVYVASVRADTAAGRLPVLPYDLLRSQTNASEILGAINNTLSDTLMIIRRVGYQSLGVLHRTFDQEIIRKQIIELQFKGLADPSSEIQSLSLDNLADLDRKLINASQTNQLVRLIDETFPNKDVLLLLVGRLSDQSAVPAIRRFTQPGNSAKVRWAALLSLARLGDQDAISTVDSKIQNLEVNSDVVYNIVPNLIYTNQKQLYDFLVEELNGNQRNCEPANPDETEPINCAFRILEMLAPKVEDFPIGITASGDLDTSNYRQALETAREWFAANPDYQIVLGE